jgi:hypothetical protein
VRLDGTLLVTLAPAALALRIGHHAPLAAYIAQRAALPLDAAGLRAVYARAQRLNELALLLTEADEVVVSSLETFCRK